METPDETQPHGVDIGHGRVLPGSALRFAFSRSSGPGGQNVNKVASKARLTVDGADLRAALGVEAAARMRAMFPSRFNEDELAIVCDENRSQLRNRAMCVERLRDMAMAALRPPKPRKKTGVPWGQKQRRLRAKEHRGEIKRGRGGPGGDA